MNKHEPGESRTPQDTVRALRREAGRLERLSELYPPLPFYRPPFLAVRDKALELADMMETQLNQIKALETA